MGTASLHVKNREATTDDLEGGPRAYGRFPIISMIQGQELRLRVHFRKSSGQEHARFCPVAACAHKLLEDGSVRLSFETIHDVSPVEILRDALAKLSTKVDHFARVVPTTDPKV